MKCILCGIRESLYESFFRCHFCQPCLSKSFEEIYGDEIRKQLEKSTK